MKVSEIFSSIQGEGLYVGTPQVFIRLSGCNLDCSWCDTQYAMSGGRQMEPREVAALVEKEAATSVCITGGEPLLQEAELRLLIARLKDMGLEVVIETNGTIYDEEIFNLADCMVMDLKPPSSGMESDESIIGKLGVKDQLKIVVADEADMVFAARIAGSRPPCPVILQPATRADTVKIAEKVLSQGLDVRVIPQVHKLMGLK